MLSLFSVMVRLHTAVSRGSTLYTLCTCVWLLRRSNGKIKQHKTWDNIFAKEDKLDSSGSTTSLTPLILQGLKVITRNNCTYAEGNLGTRLMILYHWATAAAQLAEFKLPHIYKSWESKAWYFVTLSIVYGTCSSVLDMRETNKSGFLKKMDYSQ